MNPDQGTRSLYKHTGSFYSTSNTRSCRCSSAKLCVQHLSNARRSCGGLLSTKGAAPALLVENASPCRTHTASTDRLRGPSVALAYQYHPAEYNRDAARLCPMFISKRLRRCGRESGTVNTEGRIAREDSARLWERARYPPMPIPTDPASVAGLFEHTFKNHEAAILASPLCADPSSPLHQRVGCDIQSHSRTPVPPSCLLQTICMAERQGLRIVN